MKPTNQASVLLSVVPVLPAAGHPIAACVPVPPWMFCSRISLASAATPSVKMRTFLTRKRLGSSLPSSTRPSANLIFLIAVGRSR